MSSSAYCSTLSGSSTSLSFEQFDQALSIARSLSAILISEFEARPKKEGSPKAPLFVVPDSDQVQNMNLTMN